MLAIALAFAPPASGQTLSGRITDVTTGAPIQAVLVELLSLDSTRLAAVLSSDAGAYRINVPAPGRYRLRFQRLGYSLATLGPVEVDGDVTFDATLDSEPFVLAPIDVTGDSRCAVRPESAQRTAQLWEQIRTALEVTTVVRRAELLRFTLLRFVREIDIERRNLLREEVQVWAGRSPFESLAAELLVRDGFIQPDDSMRLSFYMPDPTVILADAFLDSHCFSVVEQRQGDRTLYGLAFEPLEDRDSRRQAGQNPFFERLVEDEGSDVSGVLWVDAATGALETLEYRYEGLRSEDFAGVAGGYAEFEQLAGGAFAVRHWYVRMPVLRLVRSGRTTRLEVAAIQDEGGAIVRAETAEGMPASRRPGRPLRGRIAAGDLPIALDSAVARLSGTPHFAYADSTGVFDIPDVPPGRYLATYHHPLLDTLGIRGPIREIMVGGDEGEVVLPGPERADVLRRVCPDMDDDSENGALLVWMPRETPIRGALDRILLRSAANGRRVGLAVANDDGFARFCDVPTGVSLEVVPPLEFGAMLHIVVPATGFARVDIPGR